MEGWVGKEGEKGGWGRRKGRREGEAYCFDTFGELDIGRYLLFESVSDVIPMLKVERLKVRQDIYFGFVRASGS